MTDMRVASRRAAQRTAVSCAVLVLWALTACSPTFNWRETPVGDDGLVALLPCKPDRAARDMPMGADTVSVDMAGCKAGGATFAVAHARADDAAQAEAWLRAWRAALRAQLGSAPVSETAAPVSRASLRPAAVRVDALPAEAGGAGAHVLWFAQARNGKMVLYQATVIGEPSSPDALATFFDSLHLP